METDPYQVLGVSPDAEQEAITSAFRRLVFLYHPDHNKSPDAPARTATINDAYRILGDPSERARYDHDRRAPAHALKDIAQVIVGMKDLQLYDFQVPKPKHGKVHWEKGIWTQISSHFPACQERGCLVLLQIDPENRHQIYQHGESGPLIRIDPSKGEFRLLAAWLDECHRLEDGGSH